MPAACKAELCRWLLHRPEKQIYPIGGTVSDTIGHFGYEEDHETLLPLTTITMTLVGSCYTALD